MTALIAGAVGSNLAGIFVGQLVESSQGRRERQRRVSVFHTRLEAMIREVVRSSSALYSHPIQIMTQGLLPIDEINQVRDEALALEMPKEMLDALTELRRASKEVMSHIDKGEEWLTTYANNFRAAAQDLQRAKSAVHEVAKRPETHV